jgi:hypothetical protein
MIIKLSPQGGRATLSVQKSGDMLIINDESFDFRQLPEGAVLPWSAVHCQHVVGDVTRRNGDLIIALGIPCDADSSIAVRFPSDIVNPPDGEVRLPE